MEMPPLKKLPTTQVAYCKLLGGQKSQSILELVNHSPVQLFMLLIFMVSDHDISLLLQKGICKY